MQCLMNLDVLVPVGAAVLVVEADSVHHLVLDVAQQVRTPPQVDRLADGQRVECNADPALELQTNVPEAYAKFCFTITEKRLH